MCDVAARLLALERENASLCAAADEAATMLDELAADNARLRARANDLVAHAELTSAIEAALRAQLAGLAVSSAGPSCSMLLEAVAAYLPRATAERELDALRSCVASAVASARCRELARAAQASGNVFDALQEISIEAERIVLVALAWLAQIPDLFHERGKMLLPHLAQLEERVAAIVNGLNTSWSESVVLMKVASIEHAVKAVETCYHEPDKEPPHPLVNTDMDISHVSASRATFVRTELESREEHAERAVERARVAEVRAQEAERANEALRTEIDIVAGRCAVFEERLRDRERDEARQIHHLRLKLAKQESNARQGHNEKNSQVDMQKRISNDLTKNAPSESSSAIPTIVPQPTKTRSFPRPRDEAPVRNLATLATELALSRDNEARTREALNQSRLGDYFANRDPQPWMLPSHGCRADTLHTAYAQVRTTLRQARSAAANARVLKLAPKTLNVLDHGAYMSTSRIHQTLSLAEKQMSTLTQLPEPIAVIRYPSSTLDRGISNFVASTTMGPTQLRRALALQRIA